MEIRKAKGIKKVISLLVITSLLICFPTVSSAVSSTDAEQQFRELYLGLLETGDNSVQDISDLDLPYMTCYAIIEDVKKNEGFLPYQCYNEYNLLKVDVMETKDGTPYLSKFHLSLEDAGFEERYATVKQMVAEVQSNLDDKMTDLDKLVWCHEYVVEKLTYINTDKTEVHMGGTSLAQGYGVCEGYARALAIFLKAENIPCELVAGGAHEWLEVNIDGKWYHVDATWDDTVANSYGTHYFLMRNDEEFGTTLSKLHGEWKTSDTSSDTAVDVTSDSTEYTDWYIHDVWNRMYYYDGYWYYVSDNAIRKNNIQGTEETVICEGTNLKITGIDDRTLTITCNGEEKELDLGERTATPTKAVTPTVQPTAAVTQGAVSPTAGVTETPTVSPSATVTVKPTTQATVTVKPTTAPNLGNTKKVKVGIPVIKSVTNKKGKKMKIVLKKKVSGAKGYEVAYSTNKKFKKSVKKLRFTGTSKTIGKLKKNKTYYVKVRAYKKASNGQRIYGSYSNIKKVKIKK